MTRTFATPLAFRESLEARLKAEAAQEGRLVNRARQVFLMERLLVRALAAFGDATLLKGGLALELRLAHARTTRDLDLGLAGRPEVVLDRLQAAGRTDTGDWLGFEVAPDPEHPTIDADGLPYEGMRLRVEPRLGGRPYGDRFGVDVVLGEPTVGVPDLLAGSDILAFVGIERPRFPTVPVAAHVAEKLHAYTLPRPRPNSRLKDLPDLALLGTAGVLEVAALRVAIEVTFHHRSTHGVPGALPDPPPEWAAPYARLARENGLPWTDLTQVAAAARSFIDPVLAGQDGTWAPGAWRWL